METKELKEKEGARKTFKVEEVDGTPFVLLIDDNIVKIGCGGALATHEEFDTPEEATAYIESKPWDLLVNLFCIIHEKLKNEK